MPELPKYGSVEKCPKCGLDDDTAASCTDCELRRPGWATVDHCEARAGEPGIPGRGVQPERPERMRRICKLCGYEWYEAPLDAEV